MGNQFGEKSHTKANELAVFPRHRTSLLYTLTHVGVDTLVSTWLYVQYSTHMLGLQVGMVAKNVVTSPCEVCLPCADIELEVQVLPLIEINSFFLLSRPYGVSSRRQEPWPLRWPCFCCVFNVFVGSGQAFGRISLYRPLEEHIYGDYISGCAHDGFSPMLPCQLPVQHYPRGRGKLGF